MKECLGTWDDIEPITLDKARCTKCGQGFDTQLLLDQGPRIRIGHRNFLSANERLGHEDWDYWGGQSRLEWMQSRTATKEEE